MSPSLHVNSLSPNLASCLVLLLLVWQWRGKEKEESKGVQVSFSNRWNMSKEEREKKRQEKWFLFKRLRKPSENKFRSGEGKEREKERKEGIKVAHVWANISCGPGQTERREEKRREDRYTPATSVGSGKQEPDHFNGSMSGKSGTRRRMEEEGGKKRWQSG